MSRFLNYEGLGGGQLPSGSSTPTPTPTPTPVFALHDRVAFWGDSITQGTFAPWIQPFLVGTGSRLLFQGPTAYNAAHFGYTTAQLVPLTGEALASNPKLLTLLAGTNDLANTADSPATIYGRLKSMWKAVIDGGVVRVVAIKVLPRNGQSALSSAREADRVTLNGLIAGYASDPDLASYAGRIRVVDLESSFNPSVHAGDGLHPNWRGARVIGAAVAAAVSPLIASGDVTALYTDPSNLVANPTLSGTTGYLGGGSSGQLADSTSVSTTSSLLTLVASKAMLDGATAQQLVLSGGSSGGATAATWNISCNSFAGASGDRFEAWVRFRLEGAANLRNLRLYTDSGANSPPNAAPTVADLGSDGAYEGVLRTYMTAAGNGSTTSDTLHVELFFDTGTNCAATLTVTKPYLRKAPAGQ